MSDSWLWGVITILACTCLVAGGAEVMASSVGNTIEKTPTHQKSYNFNWYHEAHMAMEDSDGMLGSYIGWSQVGFNYNIRPKKFVSFRLSFLNQVPVGQGENS